MKITCFQNVAFEGPAGVASWANEMGHELTVFPVYEERAFPSLDEFDLLVVLGGPMATKDEDAFPWLKAEKKYLESILATEKKVIGICLGAQILADVAGARVYRNKFPEIGWHDISLTSQGREFRAFSSLPTRLEVLQWHGDTFDIPSSAAKLASSEACTNQAFAIGDNVLAMQFHLEATGEFISRVAENDDSHKRSGPFVQTLATMLNGEDKLALTHKRLTSVFNDFLGVDRVARLS